MAGAGDVRAGGAYVELFAKDSSLQKGLAAAQTRLKNFGASFTAVGTRIASVSAAAFAPIAGAVGLFVSVGDALDDMAQKTSISVESLSALRYIAELTGNSLEDMAKATAKAQRTIVAASQGNKDAAASLASLGLSSKDLIDLSPDQLFTTLVEEISKIENPTLRAAKTLEVFGKGAGSLGELIKGGGEEIAKMTERARELGLIMSGEDAAAAASFKDALFGLTQQVAFLVGSAFSGWLQETTEYLSQIATVTARVLKANRDLITTIAKVVAVGLALGAALVTLGILFASAAAVIGGISATLSAIGAAFGVLSGAIAFIVSPVGLVVAAVVGLVAWFVTATEAGQSMVASLVAAWQQFAGEAMTSWGAIVEAIRAGDIEAAWRVVTSFLTLEWTKFTAFLQTTWAGWKGYFLGIWNDITSALAGGWEIAVATMAVAVQGIWDGLQVGWAETVAFLKQGWIGFVQVVRSIWNSVSSWIGESLAAVLESVGLVEEGTAAAVKQMGQDKAKEINDTASGSSAGVEAERAKARARIASDSDAIQEGLAEDHAKRMEEIQQAQAAEAERIAAATSATTAAQVAKVDAARKDWESAVANAQAAGAEVDKELLSPNTSPAAARASANGTAGVADAMKNISSKGTFNAMALQALSSGGGGVADKQLAEAKKLADRQEKANKTLEKIAENTAKNGGVRFA
jgi:hypothetical protein